MYELHLHMDGAVRPQTALELGKELGLDFGAATVEEMTAKMAVPADCTDLTEYLKTFEIPVALCRFPKALTRIAREVVEDQAKLGHSYVELRFAPQQSVSPLLTQAAAIEATVEGIRQGMEEHPTIRVGLILCCMRGADNHEENMETIRLTAQYLGDVVCAADLAGAEALFPTADFAAEFALARELGIPYTIHAGEADGPESIRAALAMGAKRIGHGIHAVEDEALIARLAEEGVTLEICPTSNLQTRVVEDLRDYPLRKLFDAGVRVTLNTDNPTVSGTTLPREIALMQELLGFTDEEIATMQRYAREAAFLR